MLWNFLSDLVVEKKTQFVYFNSRIHKTWVYEVVHGWHNLIVGWWFLKETIWVA